MAKTEDKWLLLLLLLLSGCGSPASPEIKAELKATLVHRIEGMWHGEVVLIFKEDGSMVMGDLLWTWKEEFRTEDTLGIIVMEPTSGKVIFSCLFTLEDEDTLIMAVSSPGTTGNTVTFNRVK